MLKFSWPEKLGDISYNFSGTELWFLRENCDSGNITHNNPLSRFGYNFCMVRLGDDEYLFKYKSQTSLGDAIETGFPTNIVFSIKKQ